jgi:hypothetical protein
MSIAAAISLTDRAGAEWSARSLRAGADRRRVGPNGSGAGPPGGLQCACAPIILASTRLRGGSKSWMTDSPAETGTAHPQGGLRKAMRAARRAVVRYLLPDAYVTRRQYRHRNGVDLDLRNPRNLSEKVCWLKLRDRSALHTVCADKIRVRDYVALRVGTETLIPTYLVAHDAAELGPEAVAAMRFVVKTNHDQGGVFICRDRSRFDWEAIRSQVRARMERNKYHEFRERQYRDVRPGLLVEALVEGQGPEGPVELKVNCFNGAPGFVQVILDRFGDRRQLFYAPDWTRMPIQGRAAALERDLPPPPCLAQVLHDAAALSEPFPFCRVDFLQDADGRAWFNEITFHPAAGLVPYRPPEIERMLGDMLDLTRLPAARRRQAELLRELAAASPRAA